MRTYPPTKNQMTVARHLHRKITYHFTGFSKHDSVTFDRKPTNAELKSIKRRLTKELGESVSVSVTRWNPFVDRYVTQEISV